MPKIKIKNKNKYKLSSHKVGGVIRNTSPNFTAKKKKKAEYRLFRKRLFLPFLKFI